ncbi:MAG: aldehyde dehydrogenase family protein [Phycisphaeraceae bacterium]|nr:aldehyde dehydrogenase family protein [Phycisphaeraceae bacterium]
MDEGRRHLCPDRLPLFLAGVPVETETRLAVRDAWSGEVACRVSAADGGVIERALAAGALAVPRLRRLPAFVRAAALEHVAARLGADAARFARVITCEAGKTLREARVEVDRAIVTFRTAAEEAGRDDGAILDFGRTEAGAGWSGLVRSVPAGLAILITPFNFPLNLVAHKVAPALAAGCPFILKPSERTPVSAILLAELLASAALPEGAFSVLPCDLALAGRLVADERPRVLSFTGSSAVGWSLPARAGRKRVLLELGGNAAAIVDADADVDHVVSRLLTGVCAQAGQSCISVQRILVHRRLEARVRAGLVAGMARMRTGDPLDASTDLGPLIDEAAAIRVRSWIDEAVAAGAVLLTGGERRGAVLTPALLSDVPSACRLSSEEAFGPVATIEPFETFEEALEQVNASRFGLQAGVFTNALDHVQRAFSELEVGAVVINDIPTLRFDAMPYGGVKESGLGREGIRAAMREMSEPRLLLVRAP